MGWIRFLAAAVAAMAICLGGLGGWLFPQMGLDPTLSRMIAGAIGGVIIALLLVRMKPGQRG